MAHMYQCWAEDWGLGVKFWGSREMWHESEVAPA